MPSPMLEFFWLHLGLAVVLFYVVNWLGKHAVHAGYLPLSLFAKTDEAPVFNFVFRVLAPVAYLFIVAVALYANGMDRLVNGLYWVTVHYFALRWLYSVVTERVPLMSWKNQLLIVGSSISLSYLAYDRLIRFRTTLLPDVTTLANELWLGIALFLYTTINSVQVLPAAAIRRRRAYIRRRVQHLREHFGTTIAREAPDPHLQALVYSVLVYEMFNRPRIARVLEMRVLFPLGLSTTLGVMQVRTGTRISDEQSVVLGTQHLRRDYDATYARAFAKYAAEAASADPDYAADRARDRAESRALRKYNIRSDYEIEVLQVKDVIIEEFYPELVPRADDDDDF